MKVYKTEENNGIIFHRHCSNKNIQVTLEHEGKYFAVNIPVELFEENENPKPHGLNLVFGKGEHYE